MNVRKLKILIIAIMSMCGLTLISTFPSLADDDKDEKHKSRAKIGLEISPVSIEVKEDEEHDKHEKKRKKMAGLGSYLVNAVAGCANCHSCPTYKPGHNPFEGGDGELNDAYFLAGGTPLQYGDETEISPNITADHNGLPAGLDMHEFMHTMRTGEHHGGDHGAASMAAEEGEHESGLLEIMPWPMYRHMTDKDLKAIYTYLASIPHAHSPPEGSCSGFGE